MLSEEIISTLLSWLPVAVFIAAWLFLSRRSQNYYEKYDRNVAEFSKSYAEIIAINKEMAATLVEIRKSLEGGKP